jgi:hypothetical protein
MTGCRSSWSEMRCQWLDKFLQVFGPGGYLLRCDTDAEKCMKIDFKEVICA